MYNTPVPKRHRKIQNEKLAQKFSFNPLKLIAGGLILIGKPFYFLISNLILVCLLLLSKLSQGTLALANLTTNIVKRPKKQKIKAKKQIKIIFPKFIIPKLSLPKIKLPTIKIPKLGTFFRIESLKVNLLELR